MALLKGLSPAAISAASKGALYHCNVHAETAGCPFRGLEIQ